MNNLQEKIASLEIELQTAKKLAAEQEAKNYRLLGMPADKDYIIKKEDRLYFGDKWDIFYNSWIDKPLSNFAKAYPLIQVRSFIVKSESIFEIGDYVVYEPKTWNYFIFGTPLPELAKLYRVFNIEGSIYNQPCIKIEFAPNSYFTSFQTEFRHATPLEISLLLKDNQPYKTGNFELGDYVVKNNCNFVHKIIGGSGRGYGYPFNYIFLNDNLMNSLDVKDFRFPTKSELFNHLVAEAAKKGIKIGNKIEYKTNHNQNKFVIEKFVLNTDLKDHEKSEITKSYSEKVFLVAIGMSNNLKYSVPIDICSLIQDITISGRIVEFNKYSGCLTIGCLNIAYQTIRDLIEVSARVPDFYIMIGSEKIDVKKLKDINERLK